MFMLGTCESEILSFESNHLTSIEFSFDPWNITAIVPGAYPGESKMWLKTLVRSRVLLKTTHSPPIYHYISEMVEDRWVHAARRLTSIEFLFDPCNVYRVGYPADARSVGGSHPSCFHLQLHYNVACSIG